MRSSRRDGLDLLRFERGLDEGERALASDRQRALDALSQALAEWRGRPLVDIAYAPFAQTAVVSLSELRASALELRIEAKLALGHLSRGGSGCTAISPCNSSLWLGLRFNRPHVARAGVVDAPA